MGIVAEPAARRRSEPLAWERTGLARHFFVALGCFYAVVAIVGFTPVYLRYLGGTRDIHWFAHLHGVLMGAWLSLFITQSHLAASGSLRQHRALGVGGMALALIIWMSMCIAPVRVRLALNPPVESVLWDVFLVELLMIVLVPIFVVWGFKARRQPGTHKRLMVFAMAIPLQAAVDRMRWLPGLDLPAHWNRDLYVYLLLVPLVVFDLVVSGRIHRVTLIGLVTLLAGHAVVNLLWGSPGWHELAFTAVNALRW